MLFGEAPPNQGAQAGGPGSGSSSAGPVRAAGPALKPKIGAEPFIIDSDDDYEAEMAALLSIDSPQKRAAAKSAGPVSRVKPAKPAHRGPVYELSDLSDEDVFMDARMSPPGLPGKRARDANPGIAGPAAKRARTSPKQKNSPPKNVAVPRDPTEVMDLDAMEVEPAGAAVPVIRVDLTQPAPPAEKLNEAALKNICEMFPDCSPDYVAERLAAYVDLRPEERADKVVDEIVAAAGSYPKRGTAPSGSSSKPNKDTLRDYGRVEEVQITFGPAYPSESRAILRHEFPRLVDTTISNALSQRNQQFAPTFTYLFQLMEMIDNGTLPRGMNVPLKDAATIPKPANKGKGKHGAGFSGAPVATDARLKEELLWVQRWKEAEAAKLSSDDAVYIMDSQNNPELAGDGGSVELECGCCFAEYPLRETVACEAGHSFCKTCARQHAETLIGARKTAIACMSTEVEGGCKSVFPRHEVRRFLPEKNFAGWEKLVQQEEIRMALGGAKLIECPFCDFAVLDESGEDDAANGNSLFHCQNPGCMVVSCRLCSKPNHLPKKCDDVVKDKALQVQHKVEEAMTDALVRTCPKCPNSRFFKIDGCNKLTCPTCGSVICYLCREIIRGYDHFSHGGDGKPNPGGKDKCALWDDTKRNDAMLVNDAATKALEELKQKDPDVTEAVKVDLAAVPTHNPRSAMEYRDQPAAAPRRAPAAPRVRDRAAEAAARAERVKREHELLAQRLTQQQIARVEALLHQRRTQLEVERLRNMTLTNTRSKNASNKKITKAEQDLITYQAQLDRLRVEAAGLAGRVA